MKEKLVKDHIRDLKLTQEQAMAVWQLLGQAAMFGSAIATVEIINYGRQTGIDGCVINALHIFANNHGAELIDDHLEVMDMFGLIPSES